VRITAACGPVGWVVIRRRPLLGRLSAQSWAVWLCGVWPLAVTRQPGHWQPRRPAACRLNRWPSTRQAWSERARRYDLPLEGAHNAAICCWPWRWQIPPGRIPSGRLLRPPEPVLARRAQRRLHIPGSPCSMRTYNAQPEAVVAALHLLAGQRGRARRAGNDARTRARHSLALQPGDRSAGRRTGLDWPGDRR